MAARRVRRAMNESSGGDGNARIVVGVDGSDGSKQAMRWAARQAEFTGATLLAIVTWQYPTFYGWVPPYPDDMDLAHLAQQALTEALDEVFGPDRPARLETSVIEGFAAQPAIVERMIADAGDVARQCHGSQIVAILKRPVADAGHAVGQADARQAGAIEERPRPKIRQAGGQGHAGEQVA